jgi:hypothetical protein|tara:strand:+ start:133 stop:330 length:198 start_codon:yes stop_codon:yes gene_type:complete
MNKQDTELVLTHLEYIKEKVDANHSHLQKLNGRVRANEVTLSWIKGIGSSITFIISCVLGYIIKE